MGSRVNRLLEANGVLRERMREEELATAAASAGAGAGSQTTRAAIGWTRLRSPGLSSPLR